MTAWEAVVSADRSQFERLRTDEVTFPGDYRERRFALDAPLMRIGRRRGGPDEPTLEIDLAGAPEDPGISRLHAVLERRLDGGYAIRDLGLDEWHDGQRRLGAARPRHRGAACGRRSRQDWRLDDVVVRSR